MENKQDIGKALEWDSEIQKDYEPLSAGEYEFTVTGLEREFFDGSEKVAPCYRAVIEVSIENNSVEYKLKHSLLLNSKFETKISSFFTAIGQKKKGETLKMNWAKVVGSKGRCKVGMKLYNGNEYPEIKDFLAPIEKTEKTFTPGAF